MPKKNTKISPQPMTAALLCSHIVTHGALCPSSSFRCEGNKQHSRGEQAVVPFQERSLPKEPMRNASFRHRRDLSRPHPTHKIVLACWTRPNISTLNTGAADLGTLSAYGSILLLLAAQKAGKSAETEIDNYSSQAGPDAVSVITF
ncbi:hypothetical protein BDBG_00220 [Blastomyces gilchristii SLH14081]|uniref:Uncharacterized protein n=1 Tax=Blastomyces gilchristii (strain SLH14081) TaxID=559298 RepID=A0A179U993_BLAGS|nr:uncharacterized protein BDBG_00220 [Blastomyces gilchristii SLH14081]OAT03511.1 hypothetical protein BDBG_00220 [Blastomyces gilchristii SLH14081]